jgi:sugar lactone lactonase YvrE
MAVRFNFLFVADRANSRVLAYNVPSLATNQAALLAYGQQTFTTSAPARTSQGLNSPYGVAFDQPGNLWVADSGNARVVRFPNLINGSAADRVLGQSSLTASDGTAMSFPLNIAFDASGALYTVDFFWNHVIRFKAAAALGDGSPPDGVLGQPNFGQIGAGSGPAGMHTPWGAAVDAQGDLWVADSHNNRVIRYNSAVNKANGAAADLVLGQPNLTSTAGGAGANQMRSPTGVCVTAAGDVWVCDYDNKRVLRFSAIAAPKCKVSSASLKTPRKKKIKITVKGTASGGSGIDFVEFSMNAGKRWEHAQGKTKWQFSKTIRTGALKVQVRAVDTRKIKSPVVKLTGKDFKK